MWGTRSVRASRPSPPRKSALYCRPGHRRRRRPGREVVAKASPTRVRGRIRSTTPPALRGRLRPGMTPGGPGLLVDRPDGAHVRRIRAADGSPGVRTELAGMAVSVFDAHRGHLRARRPRGGATGLDRAPPPRSGARPHRRRRGLDRSGCGRFAGTPGPRDQAAGRDRAGRPHRGRARGPGSRGRRDGGLARSPTGGRATSASSPSTSTTGRRRRASATGSPRRCGRRPPRTRAVRSCCRAAQIFCNGIHLDVIEARADPTAEAWRNINAIDDVCREIITCTRQLVVTAVGGNAGAGGVMLALGADQVLVRAGVVLNPHYRTMGLFGSEYWTYVLPRRVGPPRARRITRRLPTDEPTEAAGDRARGRRAARRPDALRHRRRRARPALAALREHARWLAAKAAIRAADERRRPLDTYRMRELAEMSHDIFDDRNGFAAARHAFVTKQRPAVRRPAHRGARARRCRCAHAGDRRSRAGLVALPSLPCASCSPPPPPPGWPCCVPRASTRWSRSPTSTRTRCSRRCRRPRPRTKVDALAAAKATTVARRVGGTDPDAVVVGCDSMLHIDGELVGKPGDTDTARRRWQAMAGGTGELVTGHAVLRLADGEIDRVAEGHAVTTVRFAEPSDAELEAYLAHRRAARGRGRVHPRRARAAGSSRASTATRPTSSGSACR